MQVFFGNFFGLIARHLKKDIIAEGDVAGGIEPAKPLPNRIENGPSPSLEAGCEHFGGALDMERSAPYRSTCASGKSIKWKKSVITKVLSRRAGPYYFSAAAVS